MKNEKNGRDRKMGNAIEEKSFEFAVRIVKLSKRLRESSKDYELVSQMLRSGTSIGANVAEAQYGQSQKDFISKMSIALKEANETKYWIRLLRETEIVKESDSKDMERDVDELMRLLISIIKKAKAREEK